MRRYAKFTYLRAWCAVQIYEDLEPDRPRPTNSTVDTFTLTCGKNRYRTHTWLGTTIVLDGKARP